MRARRARPRRPQRRADRPGQGLQPALHAERHRLHDRDRDRRHARHRGPGADHRGRARQIKRVHLLLAMFNALQPGVFALSGWDLVGDADGRAGEGRRPDRRRRHALDQPRRPRPARRRRARPRGPDAAPPAASTARCPSSSPTRTRSPRGCARIIDVRTACGIATAVQVDIPEVSHRAELVMVHRLADETLQITVLNFSGEEISGSIRSEHLPAGREGRRHVHGRGGRDRRRSAQLRTRARALPGTSLSLTV